MSLGLLTGPMPAGGLALLRVRLWPDSGTPKEMGHQVGEQSRAVAF